MLDTTSQAGRAGAGFVRVEALAGSVDFVKERPFPGERGYAFSAGLFSTSFADDYRWVLYKCIAPCSWPYVTPPRSAAVQNTHHHLRQARSIDEVDSVFSGIPRGGRCPLLSVYTV